MAKLPFLTNPKTETVTVGNDAIGTLEIPKLKDFSVNERIFIKEVMSVVPDLRAEAVRLAKNIADESGKKVLEIYNALTRSDTDILGEHLGDLVKFQQVTDSHSDQRRLALATAILRRLVPGWTIADTGNSEEIHPSLVSEIFNFALKEESGWEEAEEAAVEATEVDLGKQQTTPTGEKSSGESEDTGVAMNDSAQTVSETSQPG